MAADLTLRLIGRPQVSQNSEVGYRTLKRKYVVQGSRVNFTELDRFENPLFLEVGTEDEEFKGFYLVNQALQPAESTLEKAYLVREYIEVKKTWVSESSSNSGTLGVLTRRYVVLKAVHPLGYGVQEFARHPDSYGNGLQKDPWEYLPNVVIQSEPSNNGEFLFALCDTSVSYDWVRQNVSVDTSSKGIDIWSVSWVEPIRPKGRPTFSIDKKTGLEVLQRSWHLPRAEADNFVTQVLYPCVRIGAKDETYEEFLVTDYQVVPNKTIDTVSTLTVTYTKLKAVEFSQTYVQSNDLIKLRKRYAVARGDDTEYGYGANWAKHPQNPDRTDPVPSNPWEYAPAWVTQKPEAPSLDFNSASLGGFTNNPGVVTGVDGGGVEESKTLESYLTEANITSEWLEGSAAISKSSGGLDIWTVEWVCHGVPYWVLGTTSQGNNASNALQLIDFDEHGVKRTAIGGTYDGASNVKVKTYSFFVVGSDLPESLAEISGGSGNSKTNTSVNFDVWFTTSDEDGFESASHPIKGSLQNAVWVSNTAGTIDFPLMNLPVQGAINQQGTYPVGQKRQGEIIFDFDSHRDLGSIDSNNNFVMDPRGLPIYQGQPIIRMGGRITYTATSRIGTIGSSTNFDATKTQILPIFSSGFKKIWKVALTYVGN